MAPSRTSKQSGQAIAQKTTLLTRKAPKRAKPIIGFDQMTRISESASRAQAAAWYQSFWTWQSQYQAQELQAEARAAAAKAIKAHNAQHTPYCYLFGNGIGRVGVPIGHRRFKSPLADIFSGKALERTVLGRELPDSMRPKRKDKGKVAGTGTTSPVPGKATPVPVQDTSLPLKTTSTETRTVLKPIAACTTKGPAKRAIKSNENKRPIAKTVKGKCRVSKNSAPSAAKLAAVTPVRSGKKPSLFLSVKQNSGKKNSKTDAAR